jgi:hypothetical protein
VGSLDAKLTRTYALKVASDEAKAAFDAAKSDLQEALEDAHKTEHTIGASGDRPSVKAKLATRTSQTIDVQMFADAVSPEEFTASASVGLAAAKRVLGEAQIEEISTKTVSAAFLELRALGSKRK